MTAYTTILPDETVYADNHDGFWVFAYGSLMWNPDFDFSERRAALLSGYCRALCIYSWVHRGSKDKPGLVFGLHQEAAQENNVCHGVAFKIPAPAWRETVEKLRARELVTNVYQECLGEITLTDKKERPVKALFYTAVKDHPQYAGTLSDEALLRLVQQGKGVSGNNVDYVLSTFDQLTHQGIEDGVLARLCLSLRS